MTPVILVCSQDAELYLLLAHILRSEGFEARLGASEDDVVEACTSAEISAVLLDCAGWPNNVATLCALLKDAGISVGALIDRDMRAQHLQLIKAGIDEGITRPLSPSKLLAFLHGIRPRSETVSRPSFAPPEIILEPDAVIVSGKRASLPPLEVRILRLLLERQGQISTRKQIIGAVWGDPRAVRSRTIDVHIGRLRKAFAGVEKLRIRTVYGAGYVLEC